MADRPSYLAISVRSFGCPFDSSWKQMVRTVSFLAEDRMDSLLRDHT